MVHWVNLVMFARVVNSRLFIGYCTQLKTVCRDDNGYTSHK